MKFCFQSARFKTAQAATVALAWIATLAGLGLHAGNAAGETPEFEALPPAESAWRMVITAKDTLPQVAAPIAGSKDTVLAAAWKAGAPPSDEVRLLTRNQFAALNLDWAAFAARTGASSLSELAKLRPELIRDRNGVLECAILRSTQPGDDLTSVVLAPDFLKRFAPLFGSKLLVAIPDRQTVFLFPKLASRYLDYAERVLSVYRKSANPVSREVYEVSATRLRAVGAYEEP